MDSIAPVNDVSAAIQLAIAPVFLLAGIGAILSVLTIRLGRVVDRARLVEQKVLQVSAEDQRALGRELRREGHVLGHAERA